MPNLPDKTLLLTLALANMSFLSCEEKHKIEEKLDNVTDLALLSIQDVSCIIGRIPQRVKWNPEGFEQAAQKNLKLLNMYKIGMIRFDDEKYPALLREIHGMPFVLFYRGNFDCLQQNSVSVVGTRHPTRNGMKAAFELSKELAEKGYTIISGLALGIDACAHRGALGASCNIGKTVAVLASGLDTIYPPANRKLASDILQNGGCLVSEYCPGVEPLKWHFPERNRIISGLSKATVVVEAPAKSGALITADFALEQNRDLYFQEAACQYEKLISKNEPKIEDSWNVERYINDGAPVVSNAESVIELMKQGSDPCKAHKQLELELG